MHIQDAKDPKSTVSTADTNEDDRRLRPPMKCQWSYDDQLLAVQSGSGDIQVFLTSAPLLGDSSINYAVVLNSLTELMIYSYHTDSIVTSFVHLEMEPSVIGVGPTHAACCSNNLVHLFTLAEDGLYFPEDPHVIREFNGDINEVALNYEYLAVRSGDKAHLTMVRKS